jgi:hypothetical protein
MKSNRKLLEAKLEDKEVKDFLKSAEGHPFIQTWIKNYEKKLAEGEIEMGALRGQTVGDAATAGVQMQVAATLEIFSAVVRGFTRYMDDSWIKRYATDAVVFKIPKVEYSEAVAEISGGELPHTEKKIDYVTIDLSTPESEKGGKVTWTRALLEDVTFDVQAEMMEGLGHAIAVKIQSDLIGKLKDIADNKAWRMPYGAKRSISSPITWSEFLSIVGDVDAGFGRYVLTTSTHSVTSGYIGEVVSSSNDSNASNRVGTLFQIPSSTSLIILRGGGHATPSTGTYYVKPGGSDAKAVTVSAVSYTGKVSYGPADVVLVSPELYWELLNIIQLTNVLYEGSTDPVRQGVIRLALGTTIIKHGLLPARTMVALNSEKCIGMVLRRALKIEPVLFPVWNEYGFIGTVRYGASILFEGAMQWAEGS